VVGSNNYILLTGRAFTISEMGPQVRRSLYLPQLILLRGAPDKRRTGRHSKPGIQRVRALADISRSALYAFAMRGHKLTYAYVVIATKQVHRLQIRPIVHN